MASPDGAIAWCNRRRYEYTGTTPEEMRGWGWREVHHPDHTERVLAEAKGRWGAGEPWEGTYLLRSAGGEWRRFLTRAVPSREAPVAGHAWGSIRGCALAPAPAGRTGPGAWDGTPFRRALSGRRPSGWTAGAIIAPDGPPRT